MSETFQATRSLLRQLRAEWAVADEDTRYRFAFYFIGLALMGLAIILQFGWIGCLFCTGIILYAVGSDLP